MHWVKDCKYINRYRLKLKFDDGENKIANLEGIVGRKGVFEPLKSIKFFKTVKIDLTGSTICWPNGADICPDTLYQMGTPTFAG